MRTELLDVVRHLFQYRELLVELTRRDLRIRYTQAVMGVVWAVLTPLVVALSGWVIRIGISYMSGYPLKAEEVGGIAIKALGWSFFSGALSFGTASITANYALVTKVYFPRQALPLSAVATQIIDSSIGAAALILILPFFGAKFTAALLWLPLLVFLLIGLTIGITLLASCANVFYRDAKHVVQMIISFGIFFTPVFFNADTFGPRGSRMLMFNPLGPVLEGMRRVITEGSNLAVSAPGASGAIGWSPWLLAWSALWAIGGTIAAAVVFQRAEMAFAEYV
ncbi:MAG: ABC transporter permease [bacterium]